MFIEISKEVAIECSKSDNPLDEISLSINAIINSMIDRRHVIYMDLETIDILKDCSWLNPSNKKAVQWIKNKQMDLNAIKRKTTKRIIVTLNTAQEHADRFCVPYSTLRKITEAKFLCENEADYFFYINIYKFFNSSSFYSICLGNCSFHGGNAKPTIEKEAANNNLILCFVDGDQDYKNGNHGSTYKSAKKAIEKIENLPKLFYVVYGREKENLFPFKYFLQKTQDKKVWIESILKACDDEILLRFVDIKDGIKLKRLNDKRYIVTYKELLHEIFLNKVCTLNCIQTAKGDNDYCVKGIGPDFLAQIQEDFFKSYSYKIIKKTNKVDEIFGSQSFIIGDWEEMAQHIFDFGCCLSEKINFNV